MENNNANGQPGVEKGLSVFTRLKELWEATTKGEWSADDGSVGCGENHKHQLFGFGSIPAQYHHGDAYDTPEGADSDADADFIAYAHNNVPAMLVEVERLQARLRFEFELNSHLSQTAKAHFDENTELKARLEKMERAIKDYLLTRDLGSLKFLESTYEGR